MIHTLCIQSGCTWWIENILIYMCIHILMYINVKCNDNNHTICTSTQTSLTSLYQDATDQCTYDACYMHCCVGNCNSVTCTLLIKRYKSETWVKIELFHQFINHPEECRESTYPGVITIGPWSRPKWLLDYFLTKYAHGRTFAEYEASCISFAVQGKTNPWQKTLLWVTKGQGRIFSKGCFLE